MKMKHQIKQDHHIAINDNAKKSKKDELHYWQCKCPNEKNSRFNKEHILDDDSLSCDDCNYCFATTMNYKGSVNE